MSFMRLFSPYAALAAAPLCLSACRHAVPAPPEIRAVAAQVQQEVRVDVQPARTVIKVESPSGIGSAEVLLAAGAWPAKVVIQLSLRGLEELRFTHGDTTVVASVASDGTNGVREKLSTMAAASTGGPLSPESPYWMRVKIVSAAATTGSRVPLADGYFEVTVPQTFLRDEHRSFTIAWVDFYR